MNAKYAMPEWLLAVDPGRITGIALIHVANGEPEIVWSDELPFLEACNRANKSALEHGGRLRIVAERFIVTVQTAKNSPQAVVDAIEMLGAVRYIGEAYGVEQIVYHTSQKGKDFCPNPRLKAVGFWHRGGSGHARDALRHAVTHLVDCGWHHENLLQK